MLDVRKAVLAAQNYFNSVQDLMSQNGPLDIQDLRLEEVVISEDKKYWFITFGYDLATPEPKYALIPSAKINRNYKIFKINSETGEVESMKIREV
ncbi:hypothetical protein J0895_04895 [Phormidium pseudopriestleyi FRX01]|uniref:PepSY domain-containing protein n=1 Tax=Phormidium pseudopriestleyi FRX01 TaxID=1759528 RepID=A0ABS3FNK9_9CYAN|nr:hypothetical protein [Phormidium pseudopriestleyi]MBO0348452.1 hypothetical protein [Phormidium pseudopriestleyi FRX01]